jgi:hypothetical protein
MKKLILGLGLFALCSFAVAQQYDYVQINTRTGTASTIPASAATNINAVIPCTKYTDFLLSVNFKAMAAHTSALDFRWELSPDGTNWPAIATAGNSGWFGGPVGNGTTTVQWSTNVTMNSAGFFRISYITNGHAAVVTNLDIKAYYKPKRNG